SMGRGSRHTQARTSELPFALPSGAPPESVIHTFPQFIHSSYPVEPQARVETKIRNFASCSHARVSSANSSGTCQSTPKGGYHASLKSRSEPTLAAGSLASAGPSGCCLRLNLAFRENLL